jgi:hypothetical protein
MTAPKLRLRLEISTVLALGWLSACVGDAKEGLPVSPPFEDGKADVGDRETDQGPLGYGEAAGVTREITEDLEFHGYTLGARPGAVVTLDVTQRGSSRGIDTTLFVYGPFGEASGYGTTALATDDDTGWGRLSRLRALRLDAGGTYLVVVGTHDARGRGRYRIEARCESGDCTPIAPPPPSGVCHGAIAAAITRCIDDHVSSDPEWFYAMTKRDLVEQCSDVEVVAPAFDALCASPSAPTDLCALSLEELSGSYLPGCLNEAWNRELDEQCVFGDRYRDLFAPGALVIMGERELTAASTLDANEERQVLASMRSSSHGDVSTLAEAFAAVDDGVIHQTELWDASNRRAFTAYEYGAGDNSFGAIFDFGVTRVAATINDGDLYDCTTTWGPEMRECATRADCAAGLTCHGVAEAIGRGRCIDYDGAEHPAEEMLCTEATPCPAGSGLQCAGLATYGENGICRPAWLTGSFRTEPDQAIPDNAPAGTLVQLVAYGLATVDVDVKLDLVISHPRIRDLRVSLINPATAEVVIFDRERDGTELYLDDFLVRGFSGDEQVNGTWSLRVVDLASGRTGTINDFGLTITSRWD